MQGHWCTDLQRRSTVHQIDALVCSSLTQLRCAYPHVRFFKIVRICLPPHLQLSHFRISGITPISKRIHAYPRLRLSAPPGMVVLEPPLASPFPRMSLLSRSHVSAQISASSYLLIPGTVVTRVPRAYPLHRISASPEVSTYLFFLGTSDYRLYLFVLSRYQ